MGKPKLRSLFSTKASCNQPKDEVYVIVVKVIDKKNGKGISGLKITAAGSTDLGNKTTDAKGSADFGRVAKGSTYTVQLSLSDADNKKYLAPTRTINASPAQLKGSDPIKFEIEKRLLELVSVDNLFAPGIENLDIKYDIEGLQDQNVILEITSDKYTGKTVMKVDLTGAQKTTGKGKTISQVCKGSEAGLLKDKFLSPQFSPYTVTLRTEKAAPLNIDIKKDKPTKVEIDKLEITVDDAPKERLYMLNDPVRGFNVNTKIFVKKKAGGSSVTPIEFEVFYTFTPGANNTTAANSFVYSGTKTLGKKGDAAAIFWKKHADNAANSPDGFKLKCSSITPTAIGPNNGIAKIIFLPSAVSGDKFKIKAEIFESNGTTSLKMIESKEMAVWRKIKLEPYEMSGFTQVSTNGTTAIMLGFYKPEKFVEYELGTVHTLAAGFTVKYFGLWDHATSAQLNWATHQVKLPAETPSATETTDANGPAGPAQVAGRAAVQAKADAWTARIVAAYNAGLTNWAPDAAVPVNAIVSIRFEHPKYTALPAGDADSTTAEWTAFPWLRVTVEGRNIHPDRRWINGQGVSTGNRAYVIEGMTAQRNKVVVAHEAGHETKNQFKRAIFGGGDHTAGAGLMDTVASLNAFTAGEVKILQGII